MSRVADLYRQIAGLHLDLAAAPPDEVIDAGAAVAASPAAPKRRRGQRHPNVPPTQAPREALHPAGLVTKSGREG